jgi:hypothetical protein
MAMAHDPYLALLIVIAAISTLVELLMPGGDAQILR